MSYQNIDLSELGYVLPENEEEMNKMKENMQKKIKHNLKKTLGDEDINFTGKLSDSIEATKEGDVHMVIIDSPYASIVENGLAPGNKVNFDALKNWVSGKLGIPDEYLQEVTSKIYFKILREGIKPKRFVKKALKKFIGQNGMKSIRNPRKKKGGLLQKIIKSAKRLIKKIRDKLKKNETPSQTNTTKTTKKRERRIYFKDSQGNKTRGYIKR